MSMLLGTKQQSEDSPPLPTKKINRYFGIIAILHLLGLISVLLIIRSLGPKAYTDFAITFRSHVKLFLKGENPYETQFSPLLFFRYLPLSLAVLLFTVPFNLETGILFWTGLSEFFFLAGFYLLISMHNSGSLWNKLRSNLTAFTLLVGTSFPLYYTLLLGQINTFVFFAISVFLFYSCKMESTTPRRDQIIAGVALSFAMAMKNTPGLLFLLLLYRKQLWGVFTALGITFLSILIFVVLLDLPFFTFILDWINLQNKYGLWMQTEGPWMIIHTGNILLIADAYLLKGNNRWVISLLNLGIVVVLTVLLKKRQANPEIVFVILNVSMLFIGGLIWFHHLTMIYPTIILLLSHDTDWIKKSREHICQYANDSKWRILKQKAYKHIFLILPGLIFGAFLIMPLYLIFFTELPLYANSTYENTNLLLPNVVYSSFLFLFYLVVLSLGIRTLKRREPLKQEEH